MKNPGHRHGAANVDLARADGHLDSHGLRFRESRDSVEHPDSNAIIISLDVTGSMGTVPRVLQTKLPQLLGLLTRKGYATDPHIMFGAIGDATCDRVPLQVGQFESDNRMDEQLRTIFLEGNGGGQKSESYELAAYFVARQKAADNPWGVGATTLEWTLSSPPPYHSFETAPEVK